MSSTSNPILIVEDDPTFGAALKKILISEKYEVKLVTNAVDALRAIEIQTFNAVVIDCLLPLTSGAALAVKISKSKSNVPLILMSGVYTNASFVKEILFETKAKAFLKKPFDFANLLQVLSENTLKADNDQRNINNQHLQAPNLRAHLKKLEGKDDFEIFSVGKRATREQIQKFYHEISQLFHPDILPPESPEDVRQLSEEIFKRYTDAYNNLKSETSKDAYIKKLKLAKGEDFLKANALIEEGRRLLKVANPQGALLKFEEVITNTSWETDSEFSLLCAWAQLLTFGSGPDLSNFLDSIHLQLDQIPSVDRRSAVYYFVRGLYEKRNGQLANAVKNFELAIQFDSDFIEAKRELHVLNLGYSSSKIRIS